MAETQRLSREAYERLAAEHHDLTTRGRIEIADKIEAARLLGDLKENGDYHAAKEEQGKMAGRIALLESILENAEIIESVSDGSVQPGTVVEIRYDGDDITEKMLFGSIEERQGDYDVISPGSPLGQALDGATVGSTVSFEAPSGAMLQVEIVAIEA